MDLIVRITLTLTLTLSAVLTPSVAVWNKTVLTNALNSPSIESIKSLLEFDLDLSLQRVPQANPASGSLNVRKKRSFDLKCPTQTDQSAVYNLGFNPTGYPVDLISAELFIRSLPGSDFLFQSLVRQVVLDDAPPTLQDQPLLATGNLCPQVLVQLWSYTSVNFGGSVCWPLANFQEKIFYNTNCTGQLCASCDPFFNYFDSLQPQCLTRYRTVSLWSFCVNLQANQRIVFDRIIIPSDCSCSKVACTSTFPDFPSSHLLDSSTKDD